MINNVKEKIIIALVIIVAVLSGAFEYYNKDDSKQKTKESSKLDDHKENIPKILKMAELGIPDAQFAAGYSYYYGYGVKQDYSEAVSWLIKAAAGGEPNAQFLLGRCYEEGYGVDRDYKKAFEWHMRAAEQGLESVQGKVGLFYERGIGVKIDYQKAVEWYQKCEAHTKDRVAQFSIALLYLKGGYGLKQDLDISFNWFKKAAEQNYSDASFYVAWFYYQGLGREKDYIEAIRWAERAVVQGNIYAFNILGEIYDIGGYGIKQDIKKAVGYYKVAAEKGDPEGQYNLGCCYEEGKGVEKSALVANQWFQKAAEQGNVQAKAKLSKQ